MSAEARYVPAAGRAAFTRLYDPALALTMRERRFRGLLTEQVVGIDGDVDVLATAQRKPGAERASWGVALAGQLPVPDASADAVVMSLLLHHLGPAAKTTALTDALRVLRPGGRLHIADWGRPRDPLMRGAFLLLQTLDGFVNTRDHAAGRLPQFIAAAGFENVNTHTRLRTAWGSLELLSARRPEEATMDA